MEKEFYALVYGSKSSWTLRQIQKKANITKEHIILRTAGPKIWHIVLMFVPFIWFFAWLPILIWLIVGMAVKGKEIKIPKANIKKIEVNRPKFTLGYRLCITDKYGQEFYFIPRKSYWQIYSSKKYVEDFAKQLAK